MADKESPSDEEPGNEKAAVERAAKKKKLIVLGAIAVVLLLVAGGGTWFALRSFGSKETPPAVAEGEAAEHGAEEQSKDEHGKDEKDAGKDAHGKASFYDSLDPAFLANFTAGGRQHYLQLSLTAMVRDEESLAALHTHMPLVRNRIVMQLSAEQFEQLQTDEGRQQLQQKLLAAIQEIMVKETGKPRVEQVFFTNFVMQ